MRLPERLCSCGARRRNLDDSFYMLIALVMAMRTVTSERLGKLKGSCLGRGKRVTAEILIVA